VGVAAAALAVLIFVVAFRVSNIAALARDVVGTSGGALRVLSDPMLDELAKEQAVRMASLHLLKRFLQITLLAAAILVAPALLLVGLDTLGIVADERVYGILVTWQGVLASTLGVVLVSLVWR
jgi:hypothetical protein